MPMNRMGSQRGWTKAVNRDICACLVDGQSGARNAGESLAGSWLGWFLEAVWTRLIKGRPKADQGQIKGRSGTARKRRSASGLVEIGPESDAGSPGAAFWVVAVSSPRPADSLQHRLCTRSASPRHRRRTAMSKRRLLSRSSETVSSFFQSSAPELPTRRRRKTAKHIEVAYDDDSKIQSVADSSAKATPKLDASVSGSADKAKTDSDRPGDADGSALDSPKPRPSTKELRASARDNFTTTFSKLKDYRASNQAPVDLMGCAWLAERDKSPEVFRYQTLVALQLSSQTKDPVVAAAVRAMQGHQPGGLTVDSILDMDDKVLGSYICKVGFHNKKLKYLKDTAAILRDKYSGDIPDTIEGLVGLPGIGPKMAYLAMQCAWKRNLGIGVDTHVHRISNRLGWASTDKNKPDNTRIELESWIGKEYWADLNPLLVGFGQLMCLPIGPKCGDCPLADQCPSYCRK
ncbi:DNA glycosylase [Polychytrium aggregatum]|uniref:DNA glycosylase n=1 Tax=Polychytrium aggregatum TaxID=110093 RepID=UPI0022FF3F8A|nr:DNA glycosylase [Polychytrium aggregatum]KAI9199662.1 DNA glycosylase [Polychytrium aggregatum]